MTENDKYLLESMTGFGRGKQKSDDINIVCEIRSVNFRALDVRVRLPKEWYELEPQIRKTVTSFVSRGRVDVSVDHDRLSELGLVPQFNVGAATSVVNALLKFAKTNKNISPEIRAGELLGFEGLFSEPELLPTAKQVADAVNNALESALIDLVKGRRIEGQALKDVLKNLLDQAKTIVEQIDVAAQIHPVKVLQRIKERVVSALADNNFDESRIVQEAAIMAEKSDVEEELVRLKMHFNYFNQLCDNGLGVGRKLDFLCQEMLREANTIASKLLCKSVSTAIIDLKALIDKIREQVQNIA